MIKKWICLLMTAIMVLACAGGIAEGTEESENAPSMQIGEGAAAKDTETAETIAGDKKAETIRDEINKALKKLDKYAGKGAGFILDLLTDGLDSAAQALPGILETIGEKASFLPGSMKDKIDQMKTKAEGSVSGFPYMLRKIFVKGLVNQFEEEGFSSAFRTAIETLKVFIPALFPKK